MVSVITPTKLANLRREAKRRKRVSDSLSHSAALDMLAKEHGYANWSLLARSVKAVSQSPDFSVSTPFVREHMIRVSGWVKSMGKERWADHFWHHYLPTKYPASHYQKCRRIPEGWDVIRRSVESVVEGIRTVQRILAFMDATDLKPSMAFSSLFPADTTAVGLDHFLVWRDNSNRYVVTNEPYSPSRKVEMTKAWCDTNGWTYRQMPARVGMHNPCTEQCRADCSGHTVLILMSPPRKGADLKAIGDMLLSNFHALNSTNIEASLPQRTEAE